MRDMQSVGHTWLLSDKKKTSPSSNSCTCIVASGGGQEDTSDGFHILSVPPDVAFDQPKEACSLGSGSCFGAVLWILL